MKNRTTLDASIDCINKLKPHLVNIREWMDQNTDAEMLPVELITKYYPQEGARRDIENMVGLHDSLQLVINQIFTVYPELIDDLKTHAALIEAEENQQIMVQPTGDLVC